MIGCICRVKMCSNELYQIVGSWIATWNQDEIGYFWWNYRDQFSEKFVPISLKFSHCGGVLWGVGLLMMCSTAFMVCAAVLVATIHGPWFIGSRRGMFGRFSMVGMLLFSIEFVGFSL